MKGLKFRKCLFYFFFVITAALSCSGNLALAKAVAPITIYLSKKSTLIVKDPHETPALVRTIEPKDELSLVKHANLVTSEQKTITMELV